MCALSILLRLPCLPPRRHGLLAPWNRKLKRTLPSLHSSVMVFYHGNSKVTDQRLQGQAGLQRDRSRNSPGNGQVEMKAEAGWMDLQDAEP